VLHRDEQLTVVGLVNVVNDTDIPVLERRECRGFVDEPAFRVRIVRQFRGKEFQRDLTVKFEVFGAIDNSHSTVSDKLDDLEPRDRSTAQRMCRHSGVPVDGSQVSKNRFRNIGLDTAKIN
jgi:hypothetical protein